jgi:hypothetical protein
LVLAATAVAYELFLIFTTQGCPAILQSDNGGEFVIDVITTLMKMWPECIIVHGRPRHPQTQGSIERANKDVAHMVGVWMRHNDSTQWSIGNTNINFHCVHDNLINSIFLNDLCLGIHLVCYAKNLRLHDT